MNNTKKTAYLLGQKTAENELKIPGISKGDVILGGKYKNVPMEVKGVSKDENNQPVLDTTKGDRHAYGFRLKKLMPEEKKAYENNVPDLSGGKINLHKSDDSDPYRLSYTDATIDDTRGYVKSLEPCTSEKVGEGRSCEQLVSMHNIEPVEKEEESLSDYLLKPKSDKETRI